MLQKKEKRQRKAENYPKSKHEAWQTNEVPLQHSQTTLVVISMLTENKVDSCRALVQPWETQERQQPGKALMESGVKALDRARHLLFKPNNNRIR